MTDKDLQNQRVITETLAALLAHDTKAEAARHLGITRQSLQTRVEKYNLQQYVDEIAEEARDVLKKTAIKAAKNLANKVDHANPNISMEASKEVLDRAGVTKPKEVSQTNVQVNNFGQVVDGLKKELNWNEEPEVS